jgi:hypothetical protein
MVTEFLVNCDLAKLPNSRLKRSMWMPIGENVRTFICEGVTI